MESNYRKKYYETHKEQHKEYQRNYIAKNREKVNEKHRKYYHEHKDEIYASQQKYIAKNRARVTKMMHDYRKRKALEFKEQGQMFCYLPKTEKEERMILHLKHKANISEAESRALLEKNNWNIKKILNELVIERYTQEEMK